MGWCQLTRRTRLLNTRRLKYYLFPPSELEFSIEMARLGCLKVEISNMLLSQHIRPYPSCELYFMVFWFVDIRDLLLPSILWKVDKLPVHRNTSKEPIGWPTFFIFTGMCIVQPLFHQTYSDYTALRTQSSDIQKRHLTHFVLTNNRLTIDSFNCSFYKKKYSGTKWVNVPTTEVATPRTGAQSNMCVRCRCGECGLWRKANVFFLLASVLSRDCTLDLLLLSESALEDNLKHSEQQQTPFSANLN